MMLQGLVPLLPEEIALVPTQARPWLVAGLAISLALNTAAYQVRGLRHACMRMGVGSMQDFALLHT